MNEYKSAKELIAAWDRGELITTLEMGGIGPGYEQAIQIAAIEMARDQIDFDGKDDVEADWDRFREGCEQTLSRINKNLGGLSGAMFGASCWLAWMWVVIGPEELLTKARAKGESERIISCSKNFPTN